MAYKVREAFIYKAKLFDVGLELSDAEYQRIARDKVAIKRGIPTMLVSLAKETKETRETKEMDNEEKTEIVNKSKRKK